MKKYLLFSITFSIILNLNAQNCNLVNKIVDENYSYSNNSEGISMPFNKDWSVLMENNKAIVVALSDKNRQAFASVIKAKHAYKLSSSHSLTTKMIDNLFRQAAIKTTSRASKKIYIRNIKALQVEFDYNVYNMDDIIPMKGLMFMIEKGYYTYIFMFNCQPNTKSCYFPFFKSIMKNAVLEQEWYGINN